MWCLLIMLRTYGQSNQLSSFASNIPDITHELVTWLQSLAFMFHVYHVDVLNFLITILFLYVKLVLQILSPYFLMRIHFYRKRIFSYFNLSWRQLLECWFFASLTASFWLDGFWYSGFIILTFSRTYICASNWSVPDDIFMILLGLIIACEFFACGPF